MKLFSRTTALISAVALLICVATPVGANTASNPTLTCETADEWTALFDRRNQTTRTWLGADGIFTVALDGNDAFASADEDTNTFFIFSDTLMGTSDLNGKVTSGWAMPSHTSALLKGDTPETDNMEFIYGYRGNMSPDQNIFHERKWMLDCFVIDNQLYILGFSPSDDWKPLNIDMYKVPIKNNEPDYSLVSETANISELWYRTADDRYLYAFGTGVTLNTASAGAPYPDGYIYIYGYRDAMKEGSRKDMIVARIKESDFPDFSKLTYWDGSGWGNNIQECATVLNSVSCELSVSPVTKGPYNGKYIAVYTNRTEGSEVMYAIGDSPVGPFSEPVCFYTTPEHGQTGADGSSKYYTYNAKAHPHLSSGDKLLVSYNCNIRDGEQYSVDYHPRFLWLDLDPLDEGDLDVSIVTSSEAPQDVLSSVFVDASNVSSVTETDISNAEISSERSADDGSQTAALPWMVGGVAVVIVVVGSVSATAIKKKK